MKVQCPVCGREGVVEQRGNSVRVIHYEWIEGKRVFVKYKIDGNSLGTMGTERGNSKGKNELL